MVTIILTSGLYFLIRSKFIPFRYFGHGLKILFGGYSKQSDPGKISHFQALCTALSGTIGMGNLSGVAIAITTGGPGAIFWMWLSALLGMGIKFFTCTLSVMYRKTYSDGTMSGGPMIVIEQALPKRLRVLAYFFSISGLVGCLSIFQINQLTEIVTQQFFAPLLNSNENMLVVSGSFGLFVTGIVAWIIMGKLERISKVASYLVPAMIVLFFGLSFAVFIQNPSKIFSVFSLIIGDAFTAQAVLGGNIGLLIAIGFKRAAFSNEAGVGTAPMAHSSAKTSEPIREGLVAMLGPLFDTLIVCTLTACVILSTPFWQNQSGISGISLTFDSFYYYFGPVSQVVLFIVLLCFSLSTMIAYYHYYSSCFFYLFGHNHPKFCLGFYLITLILGSVSSLTLIINLLDIGFALMAIPNLVCGLFLAPKVLDELRRYTKRLEK